MTKRLMIYLCFHRGRRRGGRRREGGGEGSQSASTHNLVGCGVVSGGSSLAALEAWQSQGSVWGGLRGSRQTGAPLKSLCFCTLPSYPFKISLNPYTWCIMITLTFFLLLGAVWWHRSFPHFTAISRAPASFSCAVFGIPGATHRLCVLSSPL